MEIVLPKIVITVLFFGFYSNIEASFSELIFKLKQKVIILTDNKVEITLSNAFSDQTLSSLTLVKWLDINFFISKAH